MRKIIVLVIIIALGIVAYITNPDEAKHQVAVKEAFRSGMGKALQANGIKQESTFFSEITGRLFENVVWDNLMTSSVRRENYYLFSLTKVKYLDKEYTAGIGGFGKIHIFSKAEDLVKDKVNSLIKEGGGLKKSLGF